MQTVQSMFSGFGQLSSNFSAGMDPSTGAGALDDLRMGTSAISAMSNYSMSQDSAQAMNMEATGEDIAARNEYVIAQQKTNLINRQVGQVVGAQYATAAAGGIDIGSGSVQEAKRQAEQVADRQVQAAQSSAQVNANLRLARAAFLRSSASTTQSAGLLSSIADIAKTGLQIAAVA